MHVYEIFINSGCTVKKPFIYKFGSTKNIELHIKKNNASIRYKKNVSKDHEALISFSDLTFKDAYRKVFLLHGVLFDQDIVIKNITISIDGIKVCYDERTDGFPFVYSMISKTPMHLLPSWKSREFCTGLIEQPKSKSNNDFKQISVLSFLCSKGRAYVMDRFTNLWTSMNAYYNWYADLYNGYFRKKYHYDKECYEDIKKHLPEELKKKLNDLRDEDISKVPGSSGLIVFGDNDCLKMLMSSIDKERAYINARRFERNVTLRAKLHQFSSELSSLSTDKLEALYSYSLSLLKGRQVASTDEFFPLKKMVTDMDGHCLYFFLVFEFPYICRCNLLHGAKAPLLLSYENEHEVRQLRAAGFFVEKFLEERIPLMVTGETALSESLLSEKEKKLKSSTIDALEKHKKSVEELIKKSNASRKSIS